VCASQDPAPPPPPPPPHDCGAHNGGGSAIGLTKKPVKDKPCPRA
jgi:hypothetical protein